MTKHNALAECRTAINHQIQFLEHEMGANEAFPVTIGLLRISQDLTRRIAALPVPICAPCAEGKGFAGLPIEEGRAKG